MKSREGMCVTSGMSQLRATVLPAPGSSSVEEAMGFRCHGYKQEEDQLPISDFISGEKLSS